MAWRKCVHFHQRFKDISDPVFNILASRISNNFGSSQMRCFSVCHSVLNTKSNSSLHGENLTLHQKEKPSFKDFLLKAGQEADLQRLSSQQRQDSDTSAGSEMSFHKDDVCNEDIPYLYPSNYSGQNRKVFIKTYGCQMNVSDTEIVWSILQQNGFLKSENEDQADVILLMTCAIREGAEDKIWRKLEHLRARKEKHRRKSLKIGVLGCMAERLKSRIIDREKSVDLVCGPDAYRDLPRMLALTHNNQTAVNVLLSLEETYADIMPVKLNQDSKSAYVSIMRGCDNMCTYCIVPFTRGRERSRPVSSILQEIRALSYQGIKEVTLLGQNVNSYCDMSVRTYNLYEPRLSRNFNTIYKHRKGGLRFDDLLYKVSLIDPEMRIRFTSPHPKDFPDKVLQVIKDRNNICNQLHLPAQSGDNQVLADMRRGYTVEAYLDLVNHIRKIIPGVALTSDFIAGFCGETEEAHQRTLDLISQVQYHFAYCFPYSMRQKTRAFHRLVDNVPKDVKSLRHLELTAAVRYGSEKLHTAEIGNQHLVLVEGVSKRSQEEYVGRNESNIKVIFPWMKLPVSRSETYLRPVRPGDYITVQIVACSSQVMRGVPLYHTTLQDFHHATDNSHNVEFSVA